MVHSPTLARMPFTRVPVCPDTDTQVTFVRVWTDVWEAICPYVRVTFVWVKNQGHPLTMS